MSVPYRPKLEIFCLKCRSEPKNGMSLDGRECRCPHGLAPDFVVKLGAKLFRNLELDENGYYVKGEEV